MSSDQEEEQSQVVTTYQERWTMVDYVMFSAQSDYLKLTGRLELPPPEIMDGGYPAPTVLQIIYLLLQSLV